jgi:pSer/pThr/pTyr-binding forkhead associated (FHA) protein
MPFLSSDTEQSELRFGANLVGGRGEGSVALSALATMPPSALILVRADGGAAIRRLPSRVSVRVDGETLGSAPVELLDGSHVEVGECRLIYDNTADAQAQRAKSGVRVSGERPAPIVDPAELSPWLLRELRTGRTIPIPKAGILIGRSEECRLVVPGRGVSRRHALLEPNAAGFSVTDQSANGTLVNGTTCRARQSLARGDVLRIGDEDYRLENGAAIKAPTSESQRPTEVMPTVPGLELGTDHPEPLASLEVTRGRLRGTHFSIERPVCAIGSARTNDLRLADASVAPAHATLLLKGDTWYVTDLRSPHGTFVDGYRVAGERAMSPGCTLTVGHVAMKFRASRSMPEPETAPSGGFLEKLGRLLGVR